MGRHQLRSSTSFPEPRRGVTGSRNGLLQSRRSGRRTGPMHLGILYDNGLDDKRISRRGQPAAGRAMAVAAAEQGLPRAQVKLAEVYADGPDISGRHATACGWFLLAAMGLRGIHLHKARSEYQRVASHLTPAQIVEARRFACDWTPKRSNEPADPGTPGQC